MLNSEIRLFILKNGPLFSMLEKQNKFLKQKSKIWHPRWGVLQKSFTSLFLFQTKWSQNLTSYLLIFTPYVYILRNQCSIQNYHPFFRTFFFPVWNRTHVLQIFSQVSASKIRYLQWILPIPFIIVKKPLEVNLCTFIWLSQKNPEIIEKNLRYEML